MWIICYSIIYALISRKTGKNKSLFKLQNPSEVQVYGITRMHICICGSKRQQVHGKVLIIYFCKPVLAIKSILPAN